MSRAAKAAGIESLSIAGALRLGLSKIGKIDGVTLPDALRVLHRAAKAPARRRAVPKAGQPPWGAVSEASLGAPVVLIVDEAQQALTSADGEATMAALKSASSSAPHWRRSTPVC